MKISYNWLKDYCEFEMPPHVLAERLSDIGFCVETCEPFADDWVLEPEVKPNRPDCLSHIGLAREIAALTGKRLKHPEVNAVEAEELAFDDACSVRVRCRDLCPHYTARIISGVRVGPSPAWLQKRLTTCGLRPVNNVVDATNYVLLEMGQPLHAFDLALLDGPKIIVRRARRGETITTIDGTEHELSPEVCVIADASKAVAIAGIMGGRESEISEATTDVLLESARFAPASIRRTSRALGLASESSYRFERGVNPEGVERASLRACALIMELAGGRLASGMGNVRADRWRAPRVRLRYERLARVLGIEVDAARVRAIFEGQEIEVKKQTRRSITVTAPSWRADLTREIDLIEEVARIHGYDKIGEITRMPVAISPLSMRQRCERAVRRALAAAGFSEVVTYSLVPDSPLQRAQPWHRGEPIGLRNPVSAARTHLRLTNMPSLLEVKRFNAAHGTERIDVFELGKVYLPRDTSADELPQEKVCLTALTDRKDGFFVLKGVLANVLHVLHIEGKLEEEPTQMAPFEDERALMLRLGGALLGCVGVAQEQLARQYDCASPPALMEVDFDLLAQKARLHPAIRPLPRYPVVERDVAVVVAEEVRWADLHACILERAPACLESVQVFDVYRGEQVPPGKKSVAFSITLRSPERTLAGDEADAAREQIVSALKERFGAEPR